MPPDPTPHAWIDHPDLERLKGLELGVATSGFQAEGGLNGPDQPRTHWWRWEESGRIERTGDGADLWNRYPEAARRAQAMGLRLFRLGVEWSRLCPRGESPDPAAVEAYAERLATLRAHGLEPVVTLLHFAHPAWLGEDFWLREDAPAVFVRYARGAALALGRALARRGERPIARIVTLNEPNMLALATYAAGVFPHAEPSLAEGNPWGLVRVVRALDALMAAHALAWCALHEDYAREAWPAPDVSTNVNVLDLHTVSKGLFDLLRAPSLGVATGDLGRFMAHARQRYHGDLFAHERTRRATVARALDGALARAIRPAFFDRTLVALHERAMARRAPLDHLAIDLYDPFSAQQIRGVDALLDALAKGAAWSALAAFEPRGVRLAEPWEWRCEPDAMVRVLRALSWPSPRLPIDVDENGMAVRRDAGGAAVARDDGVTRPAYLRGYLSAVAHARVVEGLPVRAYCHWTFVDNYELGRWAPRFGLFALADAPATPDALWSDRDALGDDAAGAYARVAHCLRAETLDGGALARAFERDG